MENPLARLLQGLKERDTSLMELVHAVDEAYARGYYMVKDPNDYDDYSEFLRTEMIIDEPKFDQFMMRFANLRVRTWNLDPLNRQSAVEHSKLSVLWGMGPMGKLSIIQELGGMGPMGLMGVILKMALYLGRTPCSENPAVLLTLGGPDRGAL